MHDSAPGAAPGKKNGVAVIIGRPSSGKSTFLNAAAKRLISIVSPTPQTTRNAVRGIVNTPGGQLVFIDTPGYHSSAKKMNLRLASLARSALDGADALLYLIDASREPGEEEALTAALAALHAGKLVVAATKTDLVAPPELQGSAEALPAPLLRFVAAHIPSYDAARIIPLSAERRVNIGAVLGALFALIPADAEHADQLYPEDCYTDQQADFRIAEIIREQALRRLRDEIPHALYIEVADMEMRQGGKTLWCRAFVCVERESQKRMVIGKGASLIKAIRTESLRELQDIFPYRVDLDLRVKVQKNWRQRDTMLSKLIW